MQCTIHIDRVRPIEDVLVETFHIYDLANKEDPEVIRMEKLLAEHPDYWKAYWQQSGPCSNWGYDVLRKETPEEYQERMLQEREKRAWKRVLREAKEKNWSGLHYELSGVDQIVEKLFVPVVTEPAAA